MRIIGSGFTSSSTVKFGGSFASAVKIASETEITALSPAGSGTVDVSVTDTAGSSPAAPGDQFAYDEAPSGPWLGLNGNSGGSYLGSIADFTVHNIVFDRGGPIEWRAGEALESGGKATESGQGLAVTIDAGMIPVITIEYEGYNGRWGEANLPKGEQIGKYVSGFVKPVREILAAYPGKQILFEPINEPWGYTSPQFNGAQYADVIAALLPSAKAAGIPLADIYVAATGTNQVAPLRGEPTPSGSWVSAMYKAQPRLQSEIQGWYFHPYGPPAGSTSNNSAGIGSVAEVQREMTSGQNNIIISEVGYCSADVNKGQGCEEGESETLAAQHLTEMLHNALAYREAGWLKALLVYSRNVGGWAMELPAGKLTRGGEALESFASSYGLFSQGRSTLNPPGSPSLGRRQAASSPPAACRTAAAQMLFCAPLLSPIQYW